MTKQYRKRPVVIEACELKAYGDFVRAKAWIEDNGGHARVSLTVDDDVLYIDTLEGTMEARTGWFVIRGVEGEFYACKDTVFRATYEAVETAPEPKAVWPGLKSR